MAQAGFTPISLYFSSTAAAVPTSGNLVNGELALNTADMKLYAKNSAGTVTLLASSGGAAGTVSSVAVSGGTTGLTTSGGPITTSGTITLAGTLATTNGGTGLTSFTSGGVVYASSTSALATGSSLTFDGTSTFAVSTSATNGVIQVIGPNSGSSSGSQFQIVNGASTTSAIGNYSRVIGGAYNESLAFLNNGNDFVWYSGSERMRLTSTGLGIGTSSPNVKLQVAQSNATAVGNGSTYLGLGASENGVGGKRLIGFGYKSTNNYYPAYFGFVETVNSGSTYGDLAFYTRNVNTDTEPTERVRISSAGNVGIATSSPRGTLDVNGTILVAGGGQIQITGSVSSTGLQLLGQDAAESIVGTLGSQPLVFRTASAEKARFSTAGGFSVGTTADPGAGAIYATGNITAYYSSDIKFKENVRDIPDALATVNAIGGKLFDWKDDYIDSKGGADGYFVQKADFGVVAQDVQKVFPIAVRTREDGSLAVDYEKLGALAFAALVELTKRVEALESK